MLTFLKRLFRKKGIDAEKVIAGLRQRRHQLLMISCHCPSLDDLTKSIEHYNRVLEKAELVPVMTDVCQTYSLRDFFTTGGYYVSDKDILRYLTAKNRFNRLTSDLDTAVILNKRNQERTRFLLVDIKHVDDMLYVIQGTDDE